MLLRTLLLLLCVSSGLCATLSLFQMQKDEENQDIAAVLDNVVEPSDGNVQYSEATADDAPNDPSPQAEDGLLENTPAKEEVESVTNGAPADEAVTESPTTDQPSQDVPIVEPKMVETPIEDQPSQDGPIADPKMVETPIQDQPSQDIPVVETKTEDSPPISDQLSEDVPIVDAAETPIQDQTSQKEEDNEIWPVPKEPEVPEKAEESRWSFNSIRNSFQNMNGYFDSLVELVGGRNGVCEYRCRYGGLPAPRPGYELPEPNGCSSSLVGFQVNAALDLGIPAMTQCCNQLDMCYDTCGTSKYDCDSSFRTCLHDICSDLKKSLGFGTKVQTCESMADGLFNTVWTLGCRPYMNSQRAACVCHEEEKDEL